MKEREILNRFPTRAAAIAATALLAVGCSTTTGHDKNAASDGEHHGKSVTNGLRIRPGQDLAVYEGSAVAAVDRDTLQVRQQVSVPAAVAAARLAGTGTRRVFDPSFRYVLIGDDGMGPDDASGALKVVDLPKAGTDKAVVTLGREQLNAAGATGTVSAAQFTASTASGPELWFQTYDDSQTSGTWSSATADQYKITALWSVNIQDWKAGNHHLTKHPVPKDVQDYWQSQDCQTAYSQGALQNAYMPWGCWLVDSADAPLSSQLDGPHTVKGQADTGWHNPAQSNPGTQKVTFTFLQGTNGKPAGPVSISGAGGNGASTLNGQSGIVDSGPASGSERTMWRFTTAGDSLKLSALAHALPASTSAETDLWVFPDGRAVAKVHDGSATTGWVLTSDNAWKKIGPWPSDIQDATVESTS